jgi:hypothetical protein
LAGVNSGVGSPRAEGERGEGNGFQGTMIVRVERGKTCEKREMSMSMERITDAPRTLRAFLQMYSVVFFLTCIAFVNVVPVKQKAIK